MSGFCKPYRLDRFSNGGGLMLYTREVIPSRYLLNINDNELLTVLNKHASIKHKYIRANNSSYMTKSLRKEIMLRSRLLNKLLKTKTEESKQLYNKQRNHCVTLLRKAKRNYFAELDNRILKDIKNFGKQQTTIFRKSIPKRIHYNNK